MARTFEVDVLESERNPYAATARSQFNVRISRTEFLQHQLCEGKVNQYKMRNEQRADAYWVYVDTPDFALPPGPLRLRVLREPVRAQLENYYAVEVIATPVAAERRPPAQPADLIGADLLQRLQAVSLDDNDERVHILAQLREYLTAMQGLLDRLS